MESSHLTSYRGQEEGKDERGRLKSEEVVETRIMHIMPQSREPCLSKARGISIFTSPSMIFLSPADVTGKSSIRQNDDWIDDPSQSITLYHTSTYLRYHHQSTAPYSSDRIIALPHFHIIRVKDRE